MSSADDVAALQDLDAALDRLRHRRSSLPLRTELAAELNELEAAATATAAAERQLEELTERQRELELNSEQIVRRMSALRDRLSGPRAIGARDVPEVEAELAVLRTRRDTLDDATLEVMQALETVSSHRQAATVQAAALTDRVQHARSDLAAAEGEIDAEALGLLRRRAEQAGKLPADILGRYESLRKRLGGVAVARLAGRSCDGCHLELSATELDRLRHAPPDAILTCESCGRILLR